jgi:histidyl-tRNA synthetase
MTEEKGLDPAVADRIGEYVKHKGIHCNNSLPPFSQSTPGGPSLLDQLTADTNLMANESAKKGVSDMALLFTLLRAYNVLDRVRSFKFLTIHQLIYTIQISFDLSLARGLDYYTGIIYEATVEASAPPGFKTANAFASSSDATITPAQKKPPPKKSTTTDEDDDIDESQVGVGSIAAGGRYDGLVGMFSAAAAAEGKKTPASIPCVGVSIGMDRIFALLWPKWVENGMRSKATMAYVMAAGDGLLEERVGLVRELREAGIKVRLVTSCVVRSTNRNADGLSSKDEAKAPCAVRSGGEGRGTVRGDTGRG